MTNLTDQVLYIERTFSASRERVFAAWTQRELIRRWAPAGIRIGEAEADIRVGGRFRTEMLLHETGELHIAAGKDLEIDPRPDSASPMDGCTRAKSPRKDGARRARPHHPGELVLTRAVM